MDVDQPSSTRISILRLLSLLLVTTVLAACGDDPPDEPELPEFAKASAVPVSIFSAALDTVVVLPAAGEGSTKEVQLAPGVASWGFVLIDTTSTRQLKSCEIEDLDTMVLTWFSATERRLESVLTFTDDLPLRLGEIPPGGGRVSISCPGARRLVLAIQRTTAAAAETPLTAPGSAAGGDSPENPIDFRMIGVGILFLAGVFVTVVWVVQKQKKTKSGARQPQRHSTLPQMRTAWLPQFLSRRNPTSNPDGVQILIEKLDEVKQLLDQQLPLWEREGGNPSNGFSEEDRQSLTKIFKWTEEARAAGATPRPTVASGADLYPAVVPASAEGGRPASAAVDLDQAPAGPAPALDPGPVSSATAEFQSESSEPSVSAVAQIADDWSPAADSATAGADVASLLPESVFQQIVELGSEQSKHRLEARYAEFRHRLSAMRTTIEIIETAEQGENPGQQQDSEIRQAAARLKSVDAWLALQETGLRAGFFPLVTYLQTNHANPQSVRDRIGTDLQVSLQLLRGDDTVFSRRLDEVLDRLRPALARINRRRSDTDPAPVWLESLKSAIDLTAFDLRGVRDLDTATADAGDDQGGGAIAKVLAPGYHYQSQVLLRARVQRSESGGLSGVGSGAG